MHRILVVGGEGAGAKALLAALESIEGRLVLAPDLAAARQVLAEEPPDLVAIDARLHPPAGPDVASFLGACRKSARIPLVLALVAPGQLPAVQDAGFDDFAVASCSSEELAVRLQLLLRRRQQPEDPSALHFGDLVVDLARYEVTKDGGRMDLTFKEYELLKFLATNPGKVFTREALLNRVWGYEYFGGTRTVDVHIRRLRSKIEDGATIFIETVRNVGYRFREER
jgi:two-component system alkaline phosphatase synthesis response regulator PhoP